MWRDKVAQYEDKIIEDLTGLLNIRSVRDDSLADSEHPVGPGPREALDYMYTLAQRDGFNTHDVDHIAGRIEAGKGDEIFGILGHVDVVPEGSGWDTEPFNATVTEDRIIARGTLDDKGPTIAAYYAVKILEDMQVDWKKRIHIIIGTDEESEWKCTDRYFKTEPMPDLGIAPDADFPLIHGEKGFSSFDIIQTSDEESETTPEVVLKALKSGERYNMVPDHAEAQLSVNEQMAYVIQSFEGFLKDYSLEGKHYVDNGQLKLEIEGKSVHGMEPFKGINAGLYLIHFLNTLDLDKKAKTFVALGDDKLFDSHFGEKLDVATETKELGKLTTNIGIISYTDVDGGVYGVNLRYPNGFEFDKEIDKLSQTLAPNFEIEVTKHQVPHYVDKNDPFVQKLLQAYRNQTGDMTEPYTIGGGTYARTMEKGVAFGAMFNDSEDLMHQKNEYITKKQLFNATAIYLEAIHSVCVEDYK
ncbi:dipeptidase PepV [Macrococcoides canis]|uniref:Dipeptidase PepV n=1 Tax=Macrococcoides canis TaxID=1855823 RepID=A0A4R6C809_9STAP|nr:dipeptidase PepV [Macrococcus canis]MEE1107268.1 dipeptidase PepV [Macrococcus canis]TDM18624.1 dipeptidase PepV [Macrococcus canis]TDM21331.1 dipeptidase PepV [Macrococcus canis]TDM38570.1 dipeptidase PepV [Macrococcus canis]